MVLSRLALVGLLSSSLAYAAPPAPVMTVSPAEASADLRLLEDWVNQTSDSADIAGVTAVLDRISIAASGISPKIKTRRLPCTELTANGKPKFADSLVIEVPGTLPQYITMIGHADTVFPAVSGNVATPFRYVDSGKKIVGSGVADAKGGIVIALRAIRLVLAQGTPKYSIRLIVAGNEEVGSIGHSNHYTDLSKDSVAIFGLEPSVHGHILHGRGGVHSYEVTVTGKEAHAGARPQEGVNACLDLAIKMIEFSEINDYSTNVRANVGVIQGGKKSNVVCGEATAKLDTRFPEPAEDLRIETRIKDIFLVPRVKSADGLGVETRTTIKTISVTPAFAPNFSAIKPVIDSFLTKLEQLEGARYTSKYTGAGADISRMTGTTELMIDGLGVVGDKSHTAEEYVITSSVKTRAEALAFLLTEVK